MDHTHHSNFPSSTVQVPPKPNRTSSRDDDDKVMDSDDCEAPHRQREVHGGAAASTRRFWSELLRVAVRGGEEIYSQRDLQGWLNDKGFLPVCQFAKNEPEAVHDREREHGPCA